MSQISDNYASKRNPFIRTIKPENGHNANFVATDSNQ